MSRKRPILTHKQSIASINLTERARHDPEVASDLDWLAQHPHTINRFLREPYYSRLKEARRETVRTYRRLVGLCRCLRSEVQT